MSLQSSKGFRIPLQTIVIDDFDEAMKRISGVEFLPDKIIVRTVASYPAIKTTIMMLEVRICGNNGHFYVTDLINLSDWHYDEGLIFFSSEEKFFAIPLKCAEMIIFTDGVKTKTFSKN